MVILTADTRCDVTILSFQELLKTSYTSSLLKSSIRIKKCKLLTKKDILIKTGSSRLSTSWIRFLPWGYNWSKTSSEWILTRLLPWSRWISLFRRSHLPPSSRRLGINRVRKSLIIFIQQAIICWSKQSWTRWKSRRNRTFATIHRTWICIRTSPPMKSKPWLPRWCKVRRWKIRQISASTLLGPHFQSQRRPAQLLDPPLKA